MTNKEKTIDNYIRIANLSAIENWDTKMIDNFELSLFSSSKYEKTKLSKLVKINPQTRIPNDIEISFVPMDSVSEKYGNLKEYQYRSSNKISGHTKFKENDIAWAKITPCMQNGKSFIAKNLKNGYGFGSTEFYIIRNNDDEVLDTEYLFYILRSKIVREKAVDYFTGSSGQKRVKVEFLKNLMIPLPTIDVQRRIAQIICNELTSANKIDKEIQKKIDEKNNLINIIL